MGALNIELSTYRPSGSQLLYMYIYGAKCKSNTEIKAFFQE